MSNQDLVFWPSDHHTSRLRTLLKSDIQNDVTAADMIGEIR
jgi:hypothetical protein